MVVFSADSNCPLEIYQQLANLNSQFLNSEESAEIDLEEQKRIASLIENLIRFQVTPNLLVDIKLLLSQQLTTSQIRPNTHKFSSEHARLLYEAIKWLYSLTTPQQHCTGSTKKRIGAVGCLVIQRYQILLLVGLVQLVGLMDGQCIGEDMRKDCRAMLDSACNRFPIQPLLQDFMLLFNACSLVWFKKIISGRLTNLLGQSDGVSSLLMLIYQNQPSSSNNNVFLFINRLVSMVPVDSLLTQLRLIFSDKQSSSNMQRICLMILNDLIRRRGMDIWQKLLHPFFQSSQQPAITLTKSSLSQILSVLDCVINDKMSFEYIEEPLQDSIASLLMLYQSCSECESKPFVFSKIGDLLMRFFDKRGSSADLILAYFGFGIEKYKQYGYKYNVEDGSFTSVESELNSRYLLQLCRTKIIGENVGFDLIERLLTLIEDMPTHSNDTFSNVGNLLADLFDIYGNLLKNNHQNSKSILQLIDAVMAKSADSGVQELLMSIKLLFSSLVDEEMSCNSDNPEHLDLKRICQEAVTADEPVSRAFSLQELMEILPTFKSLSHLQYDMIINAILPSLEDEDPFVNAYAKKAMKIMVESYPGCIELIQSVCHSSRVNLRLRRMVQDYLNSFLKQ